MQQIIVLGNLGKDLEEKITGTGKKVYLFSLAVSSKKDETVWYECAVWEDKKHLFNNIFPFLKKGARVIVMGNFKTPKVYKTKDGDTKPFLRIEPLSITFAGSNKKEDAPSFVPVEDGEHVPF